MVKTTCLKNKVSEVGKTMAVWLGGGGGVVLIRCCCCSCSLFIRLFDLFCLGLLLLFGGGGGSFVFFFGVGELYLNFPILTTKIQCAQQTHTHALARIHTHAHSLTHSLTHALGFGTKERIFDKRDFQGRFEKN